MHAHTWVCHLSTQTHKHIHTHTVWHFACMYTCVYNIITLSCAHNYCVYTHNNSRITSTSHWSQRDLLVESLVLIPAAIPCKQILLMMHKILLLNQVLQLQVSPHPLHPSTRRSQISLPEEEGWLLPDQ